MVLICKARELDLIAKSEWMAGDCLQRYVLEDDHDLGNWNVTQSWLMKDFYFHLYT